MTDIPALAQHLLSSLTADERAELLERLALPDREEADPLPLQAAGIVCAAALRGVNRAVNSRNTPSAEDLDQLGEVLHYAFDSFTSALEIAAIYAEGGPGHGPSSGWWRSSFDALNLRDHLGQAVREGYGWGDVPSFKDIDPVATPHPLGNDQTASGQVPAGVPEQRVHPCAPCQDCGECSCEYIKGLCRGCADVRSAREHAAADIARWKKELGEGKTYAVGSGGARLHRWDCSTLSNPEKGLEALEDQVKEATDSGEPRHVFWSRLPALFTAEELRRKGSQKRLCGICGPDPL